MMREVSYSYINRDTLLTIIIYLILIILVGSNGGYDVYVLLATLIVPLVGFILTYSLHNIYKYSSEELVISNAWLSYSSVYFLSSIKEICFESETYAGKCIKIIDKDGQIINYGIRGSSSYELEEMISFIKDSSSKKSK